jgi:hypothetical protein
MLQPISVSYYICDSPITTNKWGSRSALLAYLFAYNHTESGAYLNLHRLRSSKQRIAARRDGQEAHPVA